MIKKALALFVFSFVLTSIFSQENIEITQANYSKPQEFTIDTVTISGVQFLDKNVLANMAGFTIGSKIMMPSDDFSKTIKKFWEHGLFEDIKVTTTIIHENHIIIDLYLKERPRIGKFIIEGVSKSDKEDLREKLNIKVGSQVTENVLNDAKTIIKKFYLEKGFFNISVDIKQDADTSFGNRVNLTLKIAKNKRVKIQEIYFVGNKDIPDSKLRKSMKKTKRRDWKFWNSSKFIEAQYKEDKEKLIEYYNEKGYRDAKIILDTVHLLNNKRIALYINLYEGQKYYFRKLAWVGNTKYSSEFLSTVLGIKKGDVFDQKVLDKRLQSDDDAVSSLYLDNGYLFFSVSPVEVQVDRDSIDFEMRIYEGRQATINNILISGNTKTNEHVVRRELRTLPGELFSKSDIIRTVRELATLGHFEPEKIEPVPLPNPANSTVDIEYKLIERANDQLEVSGGWGGYYGFIGTVGIKFSNFSYRNFFNWKEWRPVPSGDGQTLSLRIQSNGTYYRSFNATFADPWFGGKKPNSLTITGYLNRITYPGNTIYQTADQRMNTIGFASGLGRRLRWPDDYFTILNEFNFERYDLKNYRLPGTTMTDGSMNNINFSTTFSRNSLDQLIYPRTGSSFSLRIQFTPPFSLFKANNFWKLSDVEKLNLTDAEVTKLEDTKKYKWVEYHKWVFKAENYMSLIGNLVLMTRANFGILGKFNKDLDYSPVEKFEVGGSGLSNYSFYNVDIVALRGYEDRMVTPTVVDGKAVNYFSSYYLNGNLYNKFSAELRYPVTLKEQATIFGLVFMEAGNCWYSSKQFNPFDVKRSAGFGVRVFLPMFGLLGFDLGYGFDKVFDANGIYSKSGWQPHFTMGQQF